MKTIKFSSSLIQEVLSGRKTVTRRPVAGNMHYSKWNEGDTVVALEPNGNEGALLEITSIGVESLACLTEKDALDEGFYDVQDGRGRVLRTARECFRISWDFFYGNGSFASNPQVYVIEFKRIEVPA